LPEKHRNKRGSWNILLGVHLGAYLIVWFFALHGIANFDLAEYTATYSHVITAALVWLPVLAVHLAVYLYMGKQEHIPDGERQAYRDGFADAMRQFRDHGDTVERLALDDEGEAEWVEVPEKRKRG
jgi:hypothetical protein